MAFLFSLKGVQLHYTFFGLYSRRALNEFCSLYWTNRFLDAVNVAYNSYGKGPYLP